MAQSWESRPNALSGDILSADIVQSRKNIAPSLNKILGLRGTWHDFDQSPCVHFASKQNNIFCHIIFSRLLTYDMCGPTAKVSEQVSN